MMKSFFTSKTWCLLSVFTLVTVFILTISARKAASNFHSPEELRAMEGDGARSPIDSGEYFLGSVRCRGCHGYDTLHHGNVDENGHDINLYDDWQSTMMALSAVDPMWRAKVSHEILVNPAHAAELQTKCTSCHAPMGHFSALFKGATQYTLSDLLGDTLGLNGVACGGCHEIASDSLIPLEYSGQLHYDTGKVEFGPFTNPDAGPMELYVGLTPTHSTHMDRSQLCAPCHTLLTNTADLNGQLTGGHFIEQATYHEWLNSSFNASQPCQRCHMPQLNDPVVIANGYLNLAPRSPFNLHQFMGGNVSMLKLIQQHKSNLGIEVPDADFDSTITATLKLLQQATVDLNLHLDSLTTDTLFISVGLTNRAGHKFPSGYPSRRAFVQIVTTDEVNDTIFQSGILQPDGEVVGHDSDWEKHYDVITDSSQVQIYEMIMGDVSGHKTTVLERAATILKDNRIPPAGFTTQHYTYDTVKIVGRAETDADFNRNGSTEGTGRDIIHYHIPLKSRTGTFNIHAALYYQTIPPGWFAEMFTYSSNFIDSFKTMYQAADKTPVLIAHGEIDSVTVIASVSSPEVAAWKVFPVPSAEGIVIVQADHPIAVDEIKLYDAQGRTVFHQLHTGTRISFSISLPDTPGMYWLQIKSGAQQTIRRIIRQ